MCKSANQPAACAKVQMWGYIFGSQVSALRSLVRVISCRCGCGKIPILNLYPNLKT